MEQALCQAGLLKPLPFHTMDRHESPLKTLALGQTEEHYRSIPPNVASGQEEEEEEEEEEEDTGKQ